MRETILVIDDSEEQLDIVKAYLEDEYIVECRDSGMDGMRYLLTHTPDLILLDIEMPHMDGYSVLERIRGMDRNMNIPIVGLTGQNSKAAVLRFMCKGGTGYLVKPVSKDNLRKSVRKFIGKTEESTEGKKHILVVDDDFNALRVMYELLKDEYELTTMITSNQALQFLYTHKPDLIILDIQMVPYNGISIYNMIKKMDERDDIPIVFVTGVNQKDVLVEATSLRPAGVFLKPVNPDDFKDKIHQLLG